MNQYISLVRLSAVAIVVVVVGALLGWYYFLHGQNAQTTAQSNAAGYNASAPTFKGSTGSTYANVVSTLGQDSGTSTPPSAARLWEVSQVPVAGFGWHKGTSAPTIYFVERSSGYVLAGNTDGRNVTRLTDTLRPKIYEASVTLDGSVLEQSVDDSGTLIAFAGIIASSTKNSTSSTQDLVGNTLPQGIHSIAADPVSDTLFFAIPGPGGVSVVSTNFAGAKEKQLFSSAIAGWRFFAPGDGSLALLQAPLDGDVGHAYQLKSGGLSLIAQAPGLTILPRASSGALIFGSSSGGTLSLYSQTSAGASPDKLSISTIADKCAWAPGAGLIAYCAVPQSGTTGQFLNDWYKGLTHTSDSIYAVDVQSASTTLLYSPADDGYQLDAEDVSVDPSGQYLAFINAKDQSLWALRIAQ